MPAKKSLKPISPKERRRIAIERFTKARKAEKQYQRQLTAIGNQVGKLVEGFAPKGKLGSMRALTKALHSYADLLRPWARLVTERMHLDVDRRDASSWAELAQEMGQALRREIRQAPTGRIMRELMAEQVELITSIPLEAAKRVHSLTQEALSATAGRAVEIEKSIMRSGTVAAGRAKTIARTETSRTAGLLMQARAQYVGSTHYIWHTAHDADVRPEHRRLDNKIFKWTEPPNAGTSTNPMYYHPGGGPNCRCWAEPILPDEIS